MLSFCLFKNQLHLASKTQQKIITLNKDDEIMHHFFDEKPDIIITLGGPYPFTRMRIILASAQGFAMGHNVDYQFIKTFDFLNHVFPNHFFMLETRRGDFFTFHKDLGEKLMTQKEIDILPYPILSDEMINASNLAQKLIEFYPQATKTKEPYYFYTPQYLKSPKCPHL